MNKIKVGPPLKSRNTLSRFASARLPPPTQTQHQYLEATQFSLPACSLCFTSHSQFRFLVSDHSLSRVRLHTRKRTNDTDNILHSVGSTPQSSRYLEEGRTTAISCAMCTNKSQTVDAIKDLVQDCNFDCNDSGIALQAMDNSHVALVSMMLRSEQFDPYRCDRNVALGINLNSLTKVLRAAQSSDVLTLKAEDSPDVVNLIFESPTNDRISEYDIKLMDIDQEHLGIPETEYSATIKLPSTEFQRITRDLGSISESGRHEHDMN